MKEEEKNEIFDQLVDYFHKKFPQVKISKKGMGCQDTYAVNYSHHEYHRLPKEIQNWSYRCNYGGYTIIHLKINQDYFLFDKTRFQSLINSDEV